MGYTFDALSGRVIAAAVEVHKQLGPGFLESIYEQAFALELTKRKIAYERQKQISITYNNQVIGKHVLDLLVEGQLVVELKAINRFEDIHFAQVKSYLRAANVNVGLLINFNSTSISVKRVVI